MDCPDRTARTPQIGSSTGGTFYNRTANDFHYEVYFRDIFGNDALLAPLATVTAGTVAGYVSGEEMKISTLVLCPGEKIVLKSVAAPPPPPPP
jgi:hypothetical protein